MTVLRGLTWAHQRGLAPFVAAALELESDHPGVRVEWEAMPWDRFRDTTLEELRTGRPRDLYVVDHPWVAGLAKDGLILGLDTEFPGAFLDSIAADVDPASSSSYRWQGGLYALPVDASCFVLPYRCDLTAGEAPPDEWAELLRWARRFHHPPRRYAFVVPWGNPTLALTSIIAATRPDVLVDTGDITDDELDLALDLLRSVWRLSAPQELLAGRRPYEMLLAEDSAVIGFGVFAYATYLAQAPDRVTFAPVPRLGPGGRRTSMLGGAGLAVATRSEHRALSLALARIAMDADFQGGAYVQSGGQPARRSAWQHGLDPALVSFGRSMARCLDGCYVRPLRPGWMRFEEGASQPIQDFLHGRATRAGTRQRIQEVATDSIITGCRATASSRRGRTPGPARRVSAPGR